MVNFVSAPVTIKPVPKKKTKYSIPAPGVKPVTSPGFKTPGTITPVPNKPAPVTTPGFKTPNKPFRPLPGKGNRITIPPGEGFKKIRHVEEPDNEKKYKGKYIGKEKYKGLTKGTPKGKYKGKYIGPDKYKGDVAAWEKDKEERRSKRRSEREQKRLRNAAGRRNRKKKNFLRHVSDDKKVHAL